MRCSCESSYCDHCKEFHNGMPGACSSEATHRVEMFGIKTRLCDPCLESAKSWTTGPIELKWDKIQEPPNREPEELVGGYLDDETKEK